MFITGRIKEILITSGGENVAPVPIEQEMKRQLRLCSFCVVVGDNKKFLSMLVTLKCTLDPKGVPTDQLDEEAIDICRGLGVEATTVSGAIECSAVHQYIKEGIERANEKAVSNVAKIKVTNGRFAVQLASTTECICQYVGVVTSRILTPNKTNYID